LNNYFKDKSIFITGGTGSFGKAFVKYLLENFPEIKRIVIFSRDELKQWQMSQDLNAKRFPQLRFFLGDIRDKDRLIRSLEGIDYVVHAAALKQVPAAEYNPFEFIKTNVIGTENLIEACLQLNIERVIALSTDKASAPINLYGASKLCSDKICIAANNIKGSKKTIFSLVRYGNVMGSRGSVIPLFIDKSKNGLIPVTDLKMTRFNITMKEAIEMVIWSLKNAIGGEIFVPRLPSYKIEDLVKAIGPNCEVENVGIRPGEKLHEEMITSSDSLTTFQLGKYFCIFPPGFSNDELKFFKKYKYLYEKSGLNLKAVKEGFCYNSGDNYFLSIEELRNLIKENVDPNFVPQ